MAKLTEEQRQARAAARTRRTALEAEERDHRNQARYEQWDREGTRLTWKEYEAGVACRGCGLPMRDGRGTWRGKGTMYLTPEERAEYDGEEVRYRERHADCHSPRWGYSDSATQHCGYCCPPPPLSPSQIEKLAKLFESFGETDPRQLDEWELTLTCDHSTRRTQHRSNGQWNNCGVVPCPECGTTRGIIESRLLGPAVGPEERPIVQQERLQAELRDAEAKLDRQRRAAEKAQRRVEDLKAQLNSRT